MDRVDVVFHSTFRVKLFIADQTSVLSSLKVALKQKSHEMIIKPRNPLNTLFITLFTLYCDCERREGDFTDNFGQTVIL